MFFTLSRVSSSVQHDLQLLPRLTDLASGMFASQQLIPAANGFDHNSAQKDLRHFPAIQVSGPARLACTFRLL